MVIMQTQKEIDDLIDRCYHNIDIIGTKFPGMSYEDGIIAAFEWIIGLRGTDPLED